MSNKDEKKKPKIKAPRKQRVFTPVRGYKDSAAGHVADKLKVMGKSLSKLVERTAKWNQTEHHAALMSVVMALSSTSDKFNELAATKFTPPTRKRGSKLVTITPGMQVFLKQEAYNMLRREKYSDADLKKPLFISALADPSEKQHLVRFESGGSEAKSLGWLNRKWLSAEPVIYE